MRFRRLHLIVVAAASLAACSDQGEPPQQRFATIRLRIIAGEERPDDTVLTHRTLVVEARNEHGQLLHGVDVKAISGHMRMLDTAARARAGVILFGDATAAQPLTAVEQTIRTDARGRATFPIVLGNRAGDASVLVEPLLIDEGPGTRGDTMRVSIRPGARAQVRFAATDTVVTRGNTLALVATVRDAYGNALPGDVALAFPVDTLASVGDGQLLALRTGRVRVVASHGAWRDTVILSIVPMGTLTGVIAAQRTGDAMRLVTLRTDGTSLREVARVVVGLDTRGQWWEPSWVPAADRIVTATPTTEPRLQTYALDGTTQPLALAPARPARGESHPRWSRDAAWIWFTGWVNGNRSELWRARPDGTDAQRVGPAATADGEMDYRPAPSPDGSHVAFVTTHGSFPLEHLAILDLATGARRVLDAAPFGGPMWSPDGGRLLYLDGARRLHVVRPDGTQDDVVGATWWVSEGSSFAWSPDGAWIVGHDGIRLRLIQVATGLEIRIPGTEDMRTVDWGR